MPYADRWTTVWVEVDEGIAWVELNRPEKRNAMSPTLNAEMVEVLETLDADDACGVLVLTGAGEAFSAGMDLKEYFREVDAGPEHRQRKVRRDAALWQWRLLRTYAKPTIAMVNGWCFGGAFTPLVACDLAKAVGQQRNLRRASRRRGDSRGCRGEVDEQHPAIVRPRPSAARARDLGPFLVLRPGRQALSRRERRQRPAERQ